MKRIISSFFVLLGLTFGAAMATPESFTACYSPSDGKYDHAIYFETDYPKNTTTAYDALYTKCTTKPKEILQSITINNGGRVFLIGFADSVGNAAYNVDLVKRRLKLVKDMLPETVKNQVTEINTGESDALAIKGDNKNLQNWRAVKIIVAQDATAVHNITIGLLLNAGLTCKQMDAFASMFTGNDKTLFDKIKEFRCTQEELITWAGTDVSVWRDADGKFNTARLASDLTAGVVLGTASGLITAAVVKKTQIKKGFEDLQCTVGGQKVADWGDEFRVGMVY